MASEAPKLVAAKVNRDGYRFRGRLIPKGRIVKVTESALQAAQRIQPPYLTAATPEEARKVGITELPAPEPVPTEAEIEAAEAKAKKR